MIAVANPGKMGDLLYALPTVWSLVVKHNCNADFYTSEYCRPLVPLLEYQPAIQRVIVPPCYKIEGFGQGVQPWKLPVCNYEDYEAVYQLGVENWPEVQMIQYYADIAGVKPREFRIECPPHPDGIPVDNRPVVVCQTQKVSPDYVPAVIEAFDGLAPVVQIGWQGEESFPGVVNEEMPDLLNTASLFKHAKVYAGGPGVNSVMSVAFPQLRSIIAVPANGMDDRHFGQRPGLQYMKDPDVPTFVNEVMRAWQE